MSKSYIKCYGKDVLKFVTNPRKRVQQWVVFTPRWFIYDCKWQNPFESATLMTKYLVGATKPIYYNRSECGDHVVAINTRNIALPEDEWVRRVYYHNTRYAKGKSWTKAYELHEADPTLIVWKAVYKEIGRTNKREWGKQDEWRGTAIKRLHCFPDDTVPDDIKLNLCGQIRPLRAVPRAVNDYSREEIENFPQIFDWPEDYVYEEKDPKDPLPLPSGGELAEMRKCVRLRTKRLLKQQAEAEAEALLKANSGEEVTENPKKS